MLARSLVLIAFVACSGKSPKQPPAPPLPPPAHEDHEAVVDAPAPAPHVPAPDAAPPPDAPSCPVVNPKGCPATEPNVNHPCAPKNISCVYDDHCCHAITYVCAKNLHFEAHLQRCP